MATMCTLLQTLDQKSNEQTKRDSKFVSIEFPLGKIVATRDALSALQHDVAIIMQLLRRHQSGDWGIVHDEDRLANDKAVLTGARIISSYHLQPSDQLLWVITEADRCTTTLILPDEY